MLVLRHTFSYIKLLPNKCTNQAITWEHAYNAQLFTISSPIAYSYRELTQDVDAGGTANNKTDMIVANVVAYNKTNGDAYDMADLQVNLRSGQQQQDANIGGQLRQLSGSPAPTTGNDAGSAGDRFRSLMQPARSKYNTAAEKQFISDTYAQAENVSIDYGIMEKAINVFVKKASFDWNDLGTWGALHDKLDKDQDNNAVVRAKTLLKGASNNMIFTERDKLVVVDGLSDYIIVEKETVLLIFPKEKEQEIKKLLTEVAETHGKKYT